MSFMKRAKQKKGLLAGVLQSVRDHGRGWSVSRLSREGCRLDVQLMHQPLLDRDYMSDLRVSPRETGRGFSRR